VNGVSLSPSLEGIHIKIVRAYQKLDEFHDAVNNFIEGDPYASVIDNNPDNEMWSVYLQMRPPPHEIAILAGEFAHNLRSALDQLAWQLVIDNRGTPNEDTAFPIFLNRYTDAGNPHKVRITPKVAIPVRAIVKEVQPYVPNSAEPRYSPLGALAWLNNVDKHRTMPTLVGTLVDTTYSILSLGTVVETGDLSTEIVEHGTMITTFPRSEFPPDMDVQLLGFPSVALDVGGLLFAITADSRDSMRQVINAVVRDVMVRIGNEFQHIE
jgi:hypothetical protein